MARTISEIYDEIIAEKESMSSLTGLTPAPDDSQTFLADLTSTSKVAIWRLWAWVTAFAINIHENVWDLFRVEITALGLTLITGTKLWYQAQCLLFQLGDTLTWNGVKFVYDPITPANQIVKFAAVQEAGGQVRIKVAKADGNGDPVKLTAGEKTAFDAYITQIKFAGTNMATISDDPDDLKVDYEVKVDPLVINPATGALVDDAGVFPVIDAINGKVKNLPFDGILVLTELTDAVQAADGVVDPILNSAEAKFGALPYSAITREYNPNAGHMVLDEVLSTITYIT